MKYVYVILIITTLSCAGYEPLTQARKSFTGNNLRLDGYYYCIGKEFSNGFNPDYADAFFLNRNGIFLNVAYGSIDSNLENEIILKDLDESVKKRAEIISLNADKRPDWGIFFTEHSAIIIENWEHSAGGGAYPTKILSGIVVNDTTIHFDKIIGAYPNNKGSKKKIKSIDETYHFREFSPKPDSTNVFIK